MMHKNVIAVFSADKAEALRVIEPLNSSFCHTRTPPFLALRRLRAATKKATKLGVFAAFNTAKT
jgi:hypothetical protein